MSKTIGIIGSRRRNKKEDYKLTWKIFKQFYDFGDKICSGGCNKGGDYFAELIMDRINLDKELRIIHYPKVDPIQRDGFRISCFKRNTLIAADSDMLIALVANDRTGGTEDTIRKHQRLHPEGKRILI